MDRQQEPGQFAARSDSLQGADGGPLHGRHAETHPLPALRSPLVPRQLFELRHEPCSSHAERLKFVTDALVKECCRFPAARAQHLDRGLKRLASGTSSFLEFFHTVLVSVGLRRLFTQFPEHRAQFIRGHAVAARRGPERKQSGFHLFQLVRIQFEICTHRVEQVSGLPQFDQCAV